MRINGIDLARALAVIGMILVNFKMVIGAVGDGWLLSLVDSLSGKAAALFVALAGVGIALMTRRGYESNDVGLIKSYRSKLLKRSTLLFIVGLSYIVIWPADILHFYAFYILITLLFINAAQKRILIAALGFIILYPFLMLILDYDTGWNFDTLDYSGFWSTKGFVRNLWYNGFHPVLPWVSFMLVGLWYGRHDLNDHQIVKKLMYRGLIGFVLILLLSKSMLFLLQSSDPIANDQLSYILGLSPMPPLPLYMIGGCFLSIFIISACIIVAQRWSGNWALNVLIQTGKLALTLYVAHVVIGMTAIYIYDESMVGKHSIEFTVFYSIAFCLLSIFFANVWLRYFKRGPLEWLFQRILG